MRFSGCNGPPKSRPQAKPAPKEGESLPLAEVHDFGFDLITFVVCVLAQKKASK